MPTPVDTPVSSPSQIAQLSLEAGWSLSMFQLEPGVFSGHFRLATCGSHALAIVDVSHDLVILGQRRPQTLSFGAIIASEPSRQPDAMSHGFKISSSCIGGWSSKTDRAFSRIPGGRMVFCNMPASDAIRAMPFINTCGASEVGKEGVARLVSMVEERMDNPDQTGSAEKAVALIADLLRSPSAVDSKPHRSSLTAERILMEMQSQGNGRVDFKELAERSGMTDRTIRTHCRESFGMTPKSIELAARLEVGRHMLAFPSVRIAKRVGPGVQNVAKFLEFSDIRAFSRAYRNQYLVSPSFDTR